jgi:hypothetical protein
MAIASIEQKFLTRINKTNGCWLWTGSLASNGYGRFRGTGRTEIAAHRFSYEYYKGLLDAGGKGDKMFDKIKAGFQDKIQNQIFNKGDDFEDKEVTVKYNAAEKIQAVRDEIKDLIAKGSATPAIQKAMDRLEECEMWLHLHLFGRR